MHQTFGTQWSTRLGELLPEQQRLILVRPPPPLPALPLPSPPAPTQQPRPPQRRNVLRRRLLLLQTSLLHLHAAEDLPLALRRRVRQALRLLVRALDALAHSHARTMRPRSLQNLRPRRRTSG